MSAPPQHDRIEIWRYQYARASLIEASEAAKFLLGKGPLRSPLQEAVVSLIVMAYARPFTESRTTASERLIPLNKKAVPPAFGDLHAELLHMRNWAIGHKDATAFPSTLLNRVVVHVGDSGIELRTTSPINITDSALRRTLELCGHPITHCEAEVRKYISYFSGVCKGVYYLSLEQSPSEWLEKKD
jgi:hypothetical protein